MSMLTPDASSAEIERALYELGDRFLQHDFMAGDPEIARIENNILSMSGSAGSAEESERSPSRIAASSAK